MLKCPVCHFSNEDGALFCEQCKSDLSSAPVAEIPMAIAEPVDEPIADVILSPFPMEAIPLEPIPLEAIPEAKPIEAVALEEIPPRRPRSPRPFRSRSWP